MDELKQVGDKTYYIDWPTKVGIYCLSDTEVCLIDSGNDKDAGRKILKILEEHNWTLKYIINTHSNADHSGGNNYLQERTECLIYNQGCETSFVNYPVLEPSFLYGGFPPKDLNNKFLLAKPSKSLNFNDISSIDGLKIINLPGHFFDMIGIETPDKVVFLGDSVFGNNIVNKYHVFFVYDVESFLKTLDNLEGLEANYYIPSHSEVLENIQDLITVNRNKIMEIIIKIKDVCTVPKPFEEIMQELFNIYNLKMDFNQYVLVGSTIRSYLSYLYNNDEIKISFIDNKLYWQTIKEK